MIAPENDNDRVWVVSDPHGVPLGASEVNLCNAVGSRLAMDLVLNCDDNEAITRLIGDVLEEVGAEEFLNVVNGALVVVVTGAVVPLMQAHGAFREIFREKFREYAADFRELADELRAS